MEATLLRGDETCQREDCCEKRAGILAMVVDLRKRPSGTVLLAPVEFLSIGEDCKFPQYFS